MSEVSLHPLNRLTTLTNRDDQALVVVGSGQGSTADATETRTALGLGDSATQDAADLPVSTATQTALDGKRDLFQLFEAEPTAPLVAGAHYKLEEGFEGTAYIQATGHGSAPFTIEIHAPALDGWVVFLSDGGEHQNADCELPAGLWRVTGYEGAAVDDPPVITSAVQMAPDDGLVYPSGTTATMTAAWFGTRREAHASGTELDNSAISYDYSWFNGNHFFLKGAWTFQTAITDVFGSSVSELDDTTGWHKVEIGFAGELTLHYPAPSPQAHKFAEFGADITGGYTVTAADTGLIREVSGVQIITLDTALPVGWVLTLVMPSGGLVDSGAGSLNGTGSGIATVTAGWQPVTIYHKGSGSFRISGAVESIS